MMEKKKYRKIEFRFGNLESAVNELKSHNELVCGSFNGKMLYSDIDDLDSAYLKVTGKTKSKFDQDEKKQMAEYEEKKQKHKNAIPELTKMWIKKGKAILDEKYHDLWVKLVPIRLDDLYEGMELGASLEIIEALNKGCKMGKAKEIINGQGHSGMSHSLVCAMVKSLCDRGTEFVNFK